MNPEPIAAGLVLRRTLDLVRQNWLLAGFAVIFLGGLGVAAETSERFSPLLTWLFVPASLIVQIAVTSAALRRAGFGGATRSRMMGMMGVSLLSTAGILLGLVLLIVPGLFVAARWAIAVPIMLEEDAGPGEALRTSWERTQGQVPTIFAALAAIYGPTYAGLIGFGILTEDAVLSVGQSVCFNLGMELGFVIGWHAAVAIYAPLTRGTDLAGVFA
jgi:uncharacterized membrane protein